MASANDSAASEAGKRSAVTLALKTHTRGFKSTSTRMPRTAPACRYDRAKRTMAVAKIGNPKNGTSRAASLGASQGNKLCDKYIR